MGGDKECIQNFSREFLEDFHLEDRERKRRITLRWILTTYVVEMASG
jgi:hypothetical protein